LVCVEVAVLLFYPVAVQVTVFGPFTKLAGDVLLLPLYNYQEALGRLIENWQVQTPESALTLIAVKVAIVGT
jgi:hypothetical protein